VALFCFISAATSGVLIARTELVFKLGSKKGHQLFLVTTASNMKKKKKNISKKCALTVSDS
jgi:hypothetical protein